MVQVCVYVYKVDLYMCDSLCVGYASCMMYLFKTSSGDKESPSLWIMWEYLRGRGRRQRERKKERGGGKGEREGGGKGEKEREGGRERVTLFILRFTTASTNHTSMYTCACTLCPSLTRSNYHSSTHVQRVQTL